jgi:serine protease Do
MGFVNRHSHITIILLSVLVGAVLTAVVLYYPQAHAPAVAQEEGGAAVAAARGLENAFVAVADHTLPAVVSIMVETRGQAVTMPENPFEGTPFDFRNPFGQGNNGDEKGDQGARPKSPRGQQRQFTPRGKGVGSGWLVREDGYIVTNSHVIRDAQKISVRLHDKDNDQTDYPAKLVGNDPRTELAIIKIDAGRKLPTIKLGSSANARVGQWVMAAGAPFELEQTFTAGIISAKGRLLPGQNQYIRIGDIIQTDAAINPGNSGGPLVNLDGDVVGINVAIVSNSMTPGNVGIGFAIPADTARNVIEQLIENKKVARGWLGISIGELNENTRDFYGAADGGALVEGITPGGPAEGTDLKVDDVVVGVEGEKVTSTWDLQRAVSTRKPGVVIKLDVIRERKPVAVEIKIGEMPAKYTGLEPEQEAAEAPESSPLGIKLEALTAETAKQLGTKRTEGVVVAEVAPDGPAAEKLQEGDIVTRINWTDVKSLEDFKAALEAARKSDKKYAVIKVERKVDTEWQSLTLDISPNW